VNNEKYWWIAMIYMLFTTLLLPECSDIDLAVAIACTDVCIYIFPLRAPSQSPIYHSHQTLTTKFDGNIHLGDTITGDNWKATSFTTPLGGR